MARRAAAIPLFVARAAVPHERAVEAFAAFLKKYIYDTTSHAEYLTLCGGAARIDELRKLEMLTDA